MTYASDLGLKVGSKIKYLSGGGLNKHDAFAYGGVITLHSDPYENHTPLFEDSDGNTEFFNIVKRKWEHYKEEEKIMTSAIKIKFPCCVPMSEIKDQETFDKIFALFIANGAGKYDTDWEDNKDYGYNYFGVDYDKDTLFYGCVESYSFNDEEDEVTTYSVTELLGLVPKEESVAEVPVTTIFPVGAEVQIAKGSEYYGCGDSCNPQDTKGIITELDDEVDFCYSVLWSNGTRNGYTVKDLVLWNEATYASPQEAITERLKDNPSVGIDYSIMGTTASIEPLISITQEVKYTVVIKGITFTFTQDELDAVAEELLGFTTL